MPIDPGAVGAVGATGTPVRRSWATRVTFREARA